MVSVIQSFRHILNRNAKARRVIEYNIKLTVGTKGHVKEVETGDLVGINGRSDKLS
jgi:hypothetical protein